MKIILRINLYFQTLNKLKQNNYQNRVLLDLLILRAGLAPFDIFQEGSPLDEKSRNFR